jgi:hypothetical protein
MDDTYTTTAHIGRSKVGANLERSGKPWRHTTEKTRHTTLTASGLSDFDMQRLGFDDGETLWDGITVQMDEGQSGMCRVLCDGAHDGVKHEATVATGVYV